MPGKILIVALDNLGDAVIGSSLLAPLGRLCPDAKLGLWVKQYAAEVFGAGHDRLRVHAADPFWDKAPGRGKGRWRDFLSALREIRAEHYDLAFILNAEWRRALACRWAGIPERVGIRCRKSALFLTLAVPEVTGRHVLEDHAGLLAAWSGQELPLESFEPWIEVTPEQRRQGERWRSGLGWEDRRVVALHPITGDPRKNWPLASWAELVSRLHGEGVRFAVLSSPQEEPLLREAFSGCPRGSLEIVVGSLSGIKPALSRADAFLGGDSGPGHMAAALQVPLLSLYGPTDPRRYRPVGRGRREALRREPLSGLRVDEVLRELRRLLESRGRPRA